MKFDSEFYRGLFADDGEGGEEGAGGGADGSGGDGADQGGEGAEGAVHGQDGGDKGGNAEASWRDDLPDDLKDHAKRFNSVADIIKGNLEQRQKLSTAIIPPGKDAGDEEVAAYRKKLGVPDAADKYEFAMPEGQEEWTDIDKAFQSAIGEAMLRHNIPATAAKDLSEVYNTFVGKVQEEQVAADKRYADESEAELRKAWPGAEFDRNKEFANRALTRLMGDGLDEARHLETKDGRFILDHPIMLKAFAAVGREMAEGGLVPSMTDSEREGINDQIADMQTKIDAAQAQGNSAEANRLYQQKMALIAKRDGNAPIVGSQGRAA